MARHITHDMVAHVLRRLGIDPHARFGPRDQDLQYDACRAGFAPTKVSRGLPGDQEVLDTLLMTALAGIAPLAAWTGAQGLTIKSGHGLRLKG